jgi:hypothetical protein
MATAGGSELPKNAHRKIESRFVISAQASLAGADNLKTRGWSLGYVSAIDSNRRTIWIADAHRDNGKRLVERVRIKS